jgi:alpha-ketoglutarate-dependent taurine dioxygenase
MTMAITVQPVTPDFAAEIGDVNLSAPLSPSDAADVQDAFTKYAVLIFPGQQLSADQHLDFAKLFGPLETTIALHRKDAKLRVQKEFADVSNLDPEKQCVGQGLAAADVSARQPALAHRLLVQAAAGARLAALRPLDPAGRRSHRVRRRTRRL